MQRYQQQFRNNINRFALRLSECAADLYSNNLLTGHNAVLTSGPTTHVSRSNWAVACALTFPFKSTVPVYPSRIIVERISKSSEKATPLVITNCAVASVARLLPRPGTTVFQYRRKNAENGNVPNQSVVQIGLSVSVPCPPIF